MSRLGFVCLGIGHLLGIAVIGRNQCHAITRKYRLYDPPHALIHRLDGRHRRLEHARVADHIAVDVVQDDHVVGILEPAFGSIKR